MKGVVLSFVLCLMSFCAMAKDFAWFCAVEWTEKKPEWVFVYEDVKVQNDGTYRIFVKWDFPETKKIAKQVWLISSDFDKILIVSSVGYDRNGNSEYHQDYPYGRDWTYVLPETYAESVVETTKEILLR